MIKDDKAVVNTKDLTEYTKEELIVECLNLRQMMQELNQKMDWLMEQVRLGNQKRFAPSSEKTEYHQFSIFNEAEVETDLNKQEPTLEQVTYTRRKKQSGKRDSDLYGLDIETTEYELTGSDLNCTECGGLLHIMGKVIHKHLKYIPAKLVVEEQIEYVYSCRNCEKNNIKVPVVRAAAPKPVIKNSIASPSLVANIMNLKYVNAVPLHRQEQEFLRNDFVLSKQTMANWMIRCATDWLEPIYEIMKKKLLQHDILFADETSVQVLNEPGRKATTQSYMWLYRTSDKSSTPICLFEYQPTRAKENPRNFLKEFKGYIHSDGYEVYHSLPEGITVVGCFAHVRRYYDEALKVIKQEERATSNAIVGYKYCNMLFSIEETFSEVSAEERYKKRLELSKPILDAFLAWALKMQPITAPKSAFGKAINYTLEQSKYLQHFLLDGRLELSNNLSERSIRDFVIGRGNWLFSKSQNGARSSATIYSIIQTLKENGIKPVPYLTHVFEQLPNIDFRESPNLLENFMPWSEEIQKRFKITKKA